MGDIPIETPGQEGRGGLESSSTSTANDAGGGVGPRQRMRRGTAIRGDVGKQRPDWAQIALGVWVVVGLLVLAVVVARSLP